jgi:nucleoside-diphosphate-sugar epimerase
MKILFIAGTKFMGACAVKFLISQGHDICIFHRGEHDNLDEGAAKRIIGDRDSLMSFKSDFAAFAPEVIIHMISHSDEHASALMEVAEGLVDRVVVISSANIYRAFEIATSPHPSDNIDTPLSEESPLRLIPLQGDNKIAVEEIVMSHKTISGTILRMPMVFGPQDSQHRLSAYLKRMDDQRPILLLEKEIAEWKACRGYVENVAHAIALTALNDDARGQIYNVSDSDALSEKAWIEKIASIVGWKGEINILEKDQLPPHIGSIVNSAQNMDLNTDKIRQQLGYTDRMGLEMALGKTIEWERQNLPDTDYDKEYKAEDEVLLTINDC